MLPDIALAQGRATREGRGRRTRRDRRRWRTSVADISNRDEHYNNGEDSSQHDVSLQNNFNRGEGSEINFDDDYHNANVSYFDGQATMTDEIHTQAINDSDDEARKSDVANERLNEENKHFMTNHGHNNFSEGDLIYNKPTHHNERKGSSETDDDDDMHSNDAQRYKITFEY